jgi:hypothetical protein
VPLHSEGEQTREELDALKAMVMKMPTYSRLFEETPTGVAKATEIFMETEHTLKVPPTTRDPPGLHEHDIIIHQYDIEKLKHGQRVNGLLTTVENGHMHSVDVVYRNGQYIMVGCDGMPHCWDGHGTHLKYEN